MFDPLGHHFCNVSDQNPSVNGKTALLSNGSNLLSTKAPSDFKGRCLKIELTHEKIQIAGYVASSLPVGEAMALPHGSLLI